MSTKKSEIINRLAENYPNFIKRDLRKLVDIFILELLNKNSLFNYTIKENALIFSSKDKNINGELNFKPFYFSSNLNFDYINQRKIFQKESLLLDLFNSELLNNSNLSAIIKIFIKKIDKFEHLEDYAFKLEFDDGRIFINDFDTKWNNSVSINSNDIEFINNEDGKRLIGEILFNFNDIERFFRYFQIKRNYRNVFDQIKACVRVVTRKISCATPGEVCVGLRMRHLKVKP